MSKIILLFLMAIAITSPAFSERTREHMKVHKTGASKENMEVDRNPINIPLAVYYDSDTNILEVWCDDDNIQAEVFVYDETEVEEVYSPYMNVTLQIQPYTYHSVRIIGDGWEANGIIQVLL